jgi:hypothetical protein
MQWKAWAKRLRNRSDIHAPRVAVRADMPWYWRGLMLIAVALAIGGASWATYHYGSEFAGFRKTEIEAEMKRLHALAQEQATELADLRARVATSESQLKIESVTYGNLTKQVKVLSEENATLKDDLAFFQSLTAASRRNDALALGRVKVEADAVPGEFKYRVLLVQGGERPADFHGHVQLVVSAQQGAEKIVISLPPVADGKSPEYQLNFKSFQRVEGAFRMAPGTVVKSVQVRVYQKGTNAPKLTKSVNVS